MNRYAKPIALMLTLVLATLAGCNAGPSQRWGAMTITYTTTLNAASDLREQGHIDDEEYRAIEAVRQPLNAALDEAHDRLVAGDDEGAGDTLDTAANLLDTLARVLATAQGASP